MRTLHFAADEVSAKRFDMIYEGFTFTGRAFKGSDLRLCAKIFDKLETLGEASEEKNGITIYKFAGKAGKVSLEEVEYNLLKTSLDEVSWNAAGARKAAPTMDWLSAIPEDKIALEK